MDGMVSAGMIEETRYRVVYFPPEASIRRRPAKDLEEAQRFADELGQYAPIIEKQLVLRGAWETVD